jgi:acetylglutamate kinase
MTKHGASPIVIKIGGTAHEASEGAGPLWDAVAHLAKLPGGVIVVHGGKDAIDRQLALAGKPVERVQGLRVTPADQIGHVEAALAGVVNGALVRALCARGARAVGLTLCDGAMATASRLRPGGVDIGHVGEVVSGDPTVVRTLLGAGFVPVVASIATGPAGEALNVNADDAAAAVAGMVGARRLVLLTGVAGVLDAGGAVVGEISGAEAEAMIADGRIVDGMIPKVRAALAAARLAECPVTIGGWSTPAERRALASGERFGTTIDATMKPARTHAEQGVQR